MATLNYAEAQVFYTEPETSPAVVYYPFTGTVNRGDFLGLSSGNVSTAATNASGNIAGIAMHASTAIWFNALGGSTNTEFPAINSQIFGPSQSGASALITAEPNSIHTTKATGNQVFEMSLSNSTGWVTGGSQQVNFGSTGGLNNQSSTASAASAANSLFIFDSTQSNKILTISGKPEGPNKGVSGDLAARVYAYFNAGTV